MKISYLVFLFTLFGFTSGQDELPITTTDVFIQSGEVTDSSIIVMMRCNNEAASGVTISYQEAENGEVMTTETSVDDSTDYTASVLIEGLTSSTEYTYDVQCAADGTTLESMQGSFQTLPAPDAMEDISFVWAADLAGQGWGRNPDLSIVNQDGETVTGGYVVFDTMLKTDPDFAVFQGDMIYADNNIPSVKEIPEEVGGGKFFFGVFPFKFCHCSLLPFGLNDIDA